MRKILAVSIGAALLSLLSGRARAVVDLELYLVASDPGTVTEGNGQTFTGGTWRVYAQLTGDTSGTLGLAGLTFNVVGNGGISV